MVFRHFLVCPGGMPMPGRVLNSPEYRFGYNGMEKDDEVKGQGNSLDYGARILDPRLNRWLSTDPLAKKFPDISPYVFAANNPIYFVDITGEEPTPAAYKAAATKLGVSVAQVRAVYKTEVGNRGYLPDGRIKILYEKHYFRDETKGKYNKSHPHLSGNYGDRYGGLSAQYDKFTEAQKLDPEAAARSISIGGFQIMGRNYKAAGFNSALEFVEKMVNGNEDDHLAAFANFIKNDTYAPEGETKLESLKSKNWKKFARNYNGPSYEGNNYDTMLQDSFELLKNDPFQGLENNEPKRERKATPPVDSSLEGYQKK